jgi:hypothetical protein
MGNEGIMGNMRNMGIWEIWGKRNLEKIIKV